MAAESWRPRRNEQVRIGARNLSASGGVRAPPRAHDEQSRGRGATASHADNVRSERSGAMSSPRRCPISGRSLPWADREFTEILGPAANFHVSDYERVSLRLSARRAQ